jgi:putative transposase
MPRTARIAPKENVYHVLTRGNNRQNIFKDESDFEKYLELLYRYKNKYYFKLYHYVLMTNHVHLVMEITDKGGSLPEIMKVINLAYAQHYKRKYRHIGHFWQDRYKSIIISKDNYLLACGSYVELNPVRAKIVDDSKEYKWSSYNAYAYGKRDLLVDENPIYSGLSGNEADRRRMYREFVKGMQREKKSQKGEMERRMIYGNENFVQEMTSTYKIMEKLKPMGRQVGWRKTKENRPL